MAVDKSKLKRELDVLKRRKETALVDSTKHLVGPPGKDGRDGRDGKDGEPGKDGKTPVVDVDFFITPGPRGFPGKDGTDGIDGLPGEAGYTPIKGVDYFDGEQGPIGPEGPIGPSGAAGAVITSSITFTNNLNYVTTSVGYSGALSTNNIIIEATNNIEESAFVALKLGVVSITEGVGYTIYAAANDNITNTLTFNLKILIF